MPEMDGLDLAARIHALRPGLPIVLASSVSQHDVAADPRWPAAGIGAVVTKPIKASPLARRAGDRARATPTTATEQGAVERVRRDPRRRTTRSGSCSPRTTS